MTRKCHCSGGCCGAPSDVNRRDFLTLVGAGAATTALSGTAWAEWLDRQQSDEERERWRKSLMERAPRVYRSGVHADARMHLGGIGTGNIEIGSDGRLTHWQLFNTLKDGEVPFWFAVRVGKVAKLLQTIGGPNAPRVKQIEMTGEYPHATLRFDDAELPVKLELSAFTPFAPLDARFSSQPLAAMVFRIQNPTSEPRTVSLAAVMQNPVGYDGREPLPSLGGECLAGNVNEPFHDGKAVGLVMRAEAGKEPAIDKPVVLHVGTRLQPLMTSPQERPKELQLELIPADGFEWVNPKDPTHGVIWFEEPSDAISAKSLAAAKGAVENGAVLVLSGASSPLLSRFAKSWKPPHSPADKRTDTVPTDRSEERLVVSLLDELLPIRFSGIRSVANADRVGPNSIAFDNLELLPGAASSTLAGGLTVFSRPLGKGKVVVATGAILDPSRLGSPKARQQAYATLCELRGVRYAPPVGIPPSACGFGTMVLAAMADDVTVLPGAANEDEAWRKFQAAGRFLPLDDAKPTAPTSPEQAVFGGVAATVEVPPGGTVEVPFLLAWRFPNKYSPQAPDNYGLPPQWIGCHYATLWPDAKAVIHEATANFAAARQRTETFRKTFYQSALPYWLLDCITSQAATIRHIGVVFRLADGDIYGWEGSNGCCNPTCTHVWGYEQSLSRLFPDLEKIMRRIDFKQQQGIDGGVNNRTAFPSPPRPTNGEHPATDGHASCILKAYREALNHPDDSFFKDYWPNVKKAVEYLVARDASKGQPDGVLEDDQHNTYDQALHGVTTFISGYYLAALRAGEEWAKRMGDHAAAERFHAIFLKGRENLVRRCWNGEYFQQDLPDYEKQEGEVAGMKTGEIGPGCMSDQLIGQWWAHQLGLGYILPKDKVQSALKSIFKYNWVRDLTGFKQIPRTFCADGSKGLLIATWPRGGRPKHVMLYSDEVWTGIEYQVAAHMIYEGMIEAGLSIARGARDRYDGVSRKPIECNPWNEIECGGHYARAMSSWSLLLAASGYEYDGAAKSLRFTPRLTPADFQSFFSGPEGWGSLRQVQGVGANAPFLQRNEIHVVEGRFAIGGVRLAPPVGVKSVTALLNGAPVDAALAPAPEGVLVTFAAPAVIQAGGVLTLTFARPAQA